ncbi:MAG: hypothetical protein ACOYJ2_04485, partial [Rickettsiales bacterium]
QAVVKDLLSIEAVRNKSYDLLRADLLKAFGEALLDRDPDTQQPRRVSPMFNSDRNNTYLTKNSSGEWITMTEDDVAKLVRDPNGPKVMVTATHAFFENMNDLTPLPEMYEKVAKAAAPNISFKAIDESPGKDDTIIICGTNTRENNFLNLEDLFRRLDDIERHQSTPWDDDFRHTSQMAVQTNALILKSIVKDEEQMERISKLPHQDGVLQSADSQGRPLLFSATAEDPLVLADNASEVARKITFVGFSKAGNAFRDGSRLIQHQLMATDEKGQPIVGADNESKTALLENLSVTGGSFNEKEFSYYWENGELVSATDVLHRVKDKTLSQEEADKILDNPYYKPYQVMIINRDDDIAPPRTFPALPRDITYDYRGGRNHADSGHTFKRKEAGVIASKDLLDYYSTTLAPNTGRAAIAHVHYSRENNSIVLTTSHTTDRELLESKLKRLEETLNANGLAVSIEAIGTKSNQEFHIRGKDGFDLITPKHIDELEQQFKLLGPQSTHGIFVSRAVTAYEIPRLKSEVSRVHHLGQGTISERTGLLSTVDLINTGNGVGTRG